MRQDGAAVIPAGQCLNDDRIRARNRFYRGIDVTMPIRANAVAAVTAANVRPRGSRRGRRAVLAAGSSCGGGRPSRCAAAARCGTGSGRSAPGAPQPPQARSESHHELLTVAMAAEPPARRAHALSAAGQEAGGKLDPPRPKTLELQASRSFT